MDTNERYAAALLQIPATEPVRFIASWRPAPEPTARSQEAELDRLIEQHGLVAFDPEQFGLN